MLAHILIFVAIVVAIILRLGYTVWLSMYHALRPHLAHIVQVGELVQQLELAIMVRIVHIIDYKDIILPKPSLPSRR